MEAGVKKPIITKERHSQKTICQFILLQTDIRFFSVLSSLDKMAKAWKHQILENYVGKFRCMLVEKAELMLEPKEIIALQTHIGTSTNDMVQLAVFLKSIRDNLKCLFPTQLKTVIGNFERQAKDNVKLVPLITDKKGKKKASCACSITFYHQS
jgi:hypothetical protein